MIKYLVIVMFLTVFVGTSAYAEDYKASMFGIKSNGTTLNTTSIQNSQIPALEFPISHGGGLPLTIRLRAIAPVVVRSLWVRDARRWLRGVALAAAITMVLPVRGCAWIHSWMPSGVS